MRQSSRTLSLLSDIPFSPDLMLAPQVSLDIQILLLIRFSITISEARWIWKYLVFYWTRLEKAGLFLF
jgi:hypothetical protein